MLSVIIPVGPDESQLEFILRDLQKISAIEEIILVVGEGKELSINEEYNCTILEAEAGRAKQMNAGASAAKGEYLWFLHADSRLSDDHQTSEWLEDIEEAPQVLYYHDLKFLKDGPSLMILNELAVIFRSNMLGMPFGDQGFIISAEWFSRLGGYNEEADYGEDHLLVWKARQEGLELKRVGLPLYTSARKYRVNGWFKTTFKHVTLTFAQAYPQWMKLFKDNPK